MTSAQIDSVAEQPANEVRGIRGDRAGARQKPTAAMNYGSYSLRWRFKLINANLIQTQIRAGLKFMSQQVLTEGDDFLYLSTARTNPQESGHC